MWKKIQTFSFELKQEILYALFNWKLPMVKVSNLWPSDSLWKSTFSSIHYLLKAFLPSRIKISEILHRIRNVFYKQDDDIVVKRLYLCHARFHGVITLCMTVPFVIRGRFRSLPITGSESRLWSDSPLSTTKILIYWSKWSIFPIRRAIKKQITHPGCKFWLGPRMYTHFGPNCNLSSLVDFILKLKDQIMCPMYKTGKLRDEVTRINECKICTAYLNIYLVI